MSIQRQRQQSSRSKQVLVKINHLSKRLPQDFFVPKALSSSPKKRQSNIQEKLAKDWYERDDSPENSPTKAQLRFIRSKRPSKISKIVEEKQPCMAANEDRLCLNKLMENINCKQSIILKAIKQVQREQRAKIIPSRGEPTEQRERVVKSQNKRYRRVQSPFKDSVSVVQKARTTLRQLEEAEWPRRQQKVNVGFDGLLTFNRFE